MEEDCAEETSEPSRQDFAPDTCESISPELDVVEIEIASDLSASDTTDNVVSKDEERTEVSQIDWKEPAAETDKLSAALASLAAPRDKDTVPVGSPPDDDTFNLSTQEGNDRLRELNEELRALNEQSSPKLSTLPSDTVAEASVSQHKRRKRKRAHPSTPQEPDKGSKRLSKQKAKRRLVEADPASSKELTVAGIPDLGDGPVGEDSDVLETANEEIDRILEEKAWKANLSAVNVKNILRYVITNENVLAMVHNSMRVDGSPALEGAFEPKLTRSKAKELLEKKVKVPWPISPLKQETPSKSKNLIELQFSESDSSSDEEYRPEIADMSEEEESFFSSPGGFTQSSPASMKSIFSPVPPPSVETESEAQPEQPVEPQREAVHESASTIALRTRSKLPLNDTPLEYIEAEFVAPDITTDMYDSECDDDEWKDFLGEFLKPLDLNPGEDEAVEDPEYNFLEEDDTPDREDLRNDKAVKITKKELQALMAELIEDAEAAAEAEDHSTIIQTEAVCHFYTDPSTCPEQQDDDSLLFNNFRRQQLDEQMRMHVQLLTQVYLLASGHESFNDIRETSDALLVELQCLSTTNSQLFQQTSSFQAHNLDGAVKLVTDFPKLPSKGTFGKRKLSWPLPTEVRTAIATSPVFIYPGYLPVCAFKTLPIQKECFHPAEDNLLAMGLEQFLPLTTLSVWKLIKEHMLPVKSIITIKNRVKNLRSTKSPDDNPVKHYYKYKSAPPPPRKLLPFDPKKVLIPSRQSENLLPRWLLPLPFEKITSPTMIRRDKKPLLPKLSDDAPPLDAELATSVGGTSTLDSSTPPSSSSSASAVNKLILTPALGFTTPNKLPRATTSSLKAAVSPVTIDPILKTPERNASGHHNHSTSTFSLGIHGSPLRASPLKKVSPILRKYSSTCLKKTGGNLPRVQTAFVRLLPKMTSPLSRFRILSPGPRMIAPKVTTPVADSTFLLDPVKVVNKGGASANIEIHESAEVATRCSNNFELEGKEDEVAAITKSVRRDSPMGDYGFGDGDAGSERHADKEARAADTQESESEAEPFDDGEDVDTADDDALDVLPDNEDDLAALMAASTTITSKVAHTRHRSSQHGSSNLRKSKSQKNDRRAVLAMLSGDLVESDPLRDDREASFAHSYLQRVKEAAGSNEELFEEFLKRLHEFKDDGSVDAVELYRDVCVILKDFPDLCEEFVAFLLPEQAMRCGKFMEFLSLSRMQVFLRKLEVHFGKHPQHIHKVLKTLAQIQQQQQNTTMDELKMAVLPLLRGQQHLVEEFLQLFPSEAPTESRMTDFEEVAVPDGDEEIDVDSDDFEVVELPDKSGGDSYGGQDCICNCHLSSDKPRIGVNWLRHCVFCGLKFIDGCIYQQTGKSLKPCQVVYLHPPRKSDGQRATADSSNAVATESSPAAGDQLASPSSSVSSLSPPVSKDSEDERDAVTFAGAVESSPIDSERRTTCYHSSVENEEAANPISEVTRSKPTRRSLNFATVNAVGSSDSGHLTLSNDDSASTDVRQLSMSVVKQADTNSATDSLDVDSPPAAEYHSVTSRLPRPRSPVTEDEDAPVLSIPDTCDSVTEDGVTLNLIVRDRRKMLNDWSREHDRLLLHTCQKNGPGSEAFSTVAAALHKTAEEVAARFQVLMTLFSRQPQRSPTSSATFGTSDKENEFDSNDGLGDASAMDVSERLDELPATSVTSQKLDDVAVRVSANVQLAASSATHSSSLLPSSVQNPETPQAGSTIGHAPVHAAASTAPAESSVLSIPKTPSVPELAVQAKNLIVDDKGKVVIVWTREHDRILLQTCQQHGPGSEAFAAVSAKLQDKSIQEVATRFQELMDLFSQQSTKEAAQCRDPVDVADTEDKS